MGRSHRTPMWILAGLLFAGLAAPAAAAGPDTLTILFTHDTHDHWLPAANEDGNGTYGGYTRLATLIKRERDTPVQAGDATSYRAPTVTLDAGDFSMGSLFQTIYSTDAPELRALGAMGYDAATLGNHEFDYRAAGLAQMLTAAADSGDPLPALVAANYKPPEEDAESRAAWDRFGVADYTIIERAAAPGEEPVRVAVFGLMGEEADSNAPMSGMDFYPAVGTAKAVVAEIQAKENPDFILCLSHSGTDNGKGEDYTLAKEVQGIDVIISGHTHTTLEDPIRVGNTLIVSCGPYTENLGRLTISKQGDALEVQEYKLIPVDDSAAEDPELVRMADQFQAAVEDRYLSQYGLGFRQVLAHNPYSFTPIRAFADQQREEPLGNLIADSYVYAVQEAEGADYIPVDFAVVASGVIRASFAPGDITTSDAFNVSSLGVGADGTPGYPLISAWIYGRELKDAFEVDASVTPLMPAAQLYGAGMEWTFNPHRLIFNKVTGCAQVLPDGARAPIEDGKLYRVVTGLYSGQMLGTVNGKSFGLLSITPRDAQGNPIDDLEAHIIHNANGAEVKEWYALASYLQSMGTVDQRYQAPEGRKTVHPSWNPLELLRNPNRIALILYAAVLAAVILVVFLVWRLRSGRRKRRVYGSHSRRRPARRRYRG